LGRGAGKGGRKEPRKQKFSEGGTSQRKVPKKAKKKTKKKKGVCARKGWAQGEEGIKKNKVNPVTKMGCRSGVGRP